MKSREIRAPKGTKLQCKGWQQEAALRMLMNNLDPDVANDPDNLIVYGGTGKAARNWESYDAIIESLKNLEDDETLLVQSGKPVGIMKTHKWAPAVIIANSNLVPKWANWDYFAELDKKGLIMYGQMTAGSWIYIGSQGILQGTYETFAAAGRTHFGSDDLHGKLVVSGGCGAMSGAQPLAATLNGATYLGAEINPAHAEKQKRVEYLDEIIEDLDTAINRAMEAVANKESVSIMWIGNITELLEELYKRNITPDLLTDQTSAHDPFDGYVPEGYTYAEAMELHDRDKTQFIKESHQTMAKHVRMNLKLQDRGAHTFDYGNNLRAEAVNGGFIEETEIRNDDGSWAYPGFVPAYIRPLFCEGKGPFRWAALSGDPKDIAITDEIILDLFPEDKMLARWIKLSGEKVRFQGLPSRICWLGYGDRAKAGLAFNKAVADGRISAPIVIGRDHLDCGSVASPNRETEHMKDGSDAIADWPLLNFALNAVSGSSWVSFHHGGGVGMGYSLHAGQVIVADGTEMMAERLERVLNNDPGTGILRHVDAGYELAKENARKHAIKIPMMD